MIQVTVRRGYECPCHGRIFMEIGRRNARCYKVVQPSNSRRWEDLTFCGFTTPTTKPNTILLAIEGVSDQLQPLTDPNRHLKLETLLLKRQMALHRT